MTYFHHFSRTIHGVLGQRLDFNILIFVSLLFLFVVICPWTALAALRRKPTPHYCLFVCLQTMLVFSNLQISISMETFDVDVVMIGVGFGK